MKKWTKEEHENHMVCLYDSADTPLLSGMIDIADVLFTGDYPYCLEQLIAEAWGLA